MRSAQAVTIDGGFVRAGALVALVAALTSSAPAQERAFAPYPVRPVTLIVPFPAGGGVDAMGRIVAERLTAALGQQVIVDNRGGAAGVIGTRAAARAAPDGYTLAMSTSGTTSINPTLYAEPGYDMRRDFSPIGLVAVTPIVIMAYPAFPAHTVAELIALARRSGTLAAGTPPPGTENNLAAELFRSMTGLDITIVTYKGTGPLTNDLLGGHIPIAFNTLAPALGNIQAGSLRAIAVAAPMRTSLLPGVPTAEESGLPGFEAAVRYGLLAPAGTPRPIIERLNADLRAIMTAPETRQRIAAQGGDPLISTPEEFGADIAREAAKWAPLIKALGLKVE
jgi:tripartite-type tricarboxylate transporter receptor subunit TctC